MGNSKNPTNGKRVFNDAFDLPKDLQDLADDVYEIGNARIGTAQQRDQFPTAEMKPGMLWIEPDTGKILRRTNAGGWVNTMIEDTGWVQITVFNNGFTSSTSSSEVVMYRRLNGVVHLKGGLVRATAQGGAPTAGAIAFGLPPGSRPGSQVRLSGRPDRGMTVIIETNGAVTIIASTAEPGPTGVGYALNGISFIADN